MLLNLEEISPETKPGEFHAVSGECADKLTKVIDEIYKGRGGVNAFMLAFLSGLTAGISLFTLGDDSGYESLEEYLDMASAKSCLHIIRLTGGSIFGVG